MSSVETGWTLVVEIENVSVVAKGQMSAEIGQRSVVETGRHRCLVVVVTRRMCTVETGFC